MQKAIVNTFSGGIERDLSINKYDNTHYYDAKNMVLNVNKELSSQALNSIKGNLPKANISGQGVKLLGYANIRDKVILFVQNGTEGAVYQFIDDGTDFDDPAQLILIYTHPDLVFDPLLPIYAVGRYETEAIQKVYFTDTQNFFYHLNIIHDVNTNDLETVNKITPNTLELLSDVTFNNIGYSVERGGNLQAGKIQYAYQFYNVNGSETVISPTSSLISLTASDDNSSSSIDYFGSKAETIVNKSVSVTIPLENNTTFIRLRLYAIQYESDIALPRIRVVGEYNVKNLSELSVTDSGQAIDTITIDELRFIQQDFVPKTLETKNNILFAGNITTRYFNITDAQFDARVFRFNTAGISVLNQGDVDKEYTILTAAGVIQNYPANDDNCYNIYNDLDQDRYRINANPITSKTTDYKYKTDGTTIGGVGKYISYEFITIPKVIDTEPRRSEVPSSRLTTGYYYPKQQVKVESPFDNYANYITSAEYVGYQRDEIYSFGIAFFDAKGRQSFVKWVGDIRFPDNNDMPFLSHDIASQHTIANILGIKFEITSAGRTVLENLGVTTYQIVRCERRDSDRTVKAAGVIAYPYTKSTENNSNKMYGVSTVPKIGDCKNKKILQDRFTYVVKHPLDNSPITDNDAVVYLQKDSLTLTDRFIEFNSPDISFEKRLNTSSSDFVEANGYLSTLSFTAISDARASGTLTRRPHVVSDKFKDFGTYPEGESQVYDLPFSRARVNTARVFTQINNQFEASYIFPDGKIYSKQAHNGKTNSDARFGLRGTHLFASLADGQQLHLPDSYCGGTTPTYDHRVMYGYYRQNPGVGIYGGTDYSSRFGRTYYKASPLIGINQTTSTLLSSSVTEVVLPPVEAMELLDATNFSVTYVDNSPDPSYFLLEVTVVGPATTAVDFTLEWYAADITTTQGPFMSTLTLPQGQVTASLQVPIDYFGLNGTWTVTSYTVYSMTVNDQYTLDSSTDNTDPSPPLTKVTITETTVDGIAVFGGDTYIGYHIDNRSMWDMTRSETNDTGRWSVKSILMYPVESRINLSLRTDDIQGYIVWHGHTNEYLGSGDDWEPTNGPKYHLQETTRQGIQMWGVNYPVDMGDLYQYNRAYSAMDKTKVFFPEPFDFVNTETHDTRVVASLPKIAGEYTDSWLKFKPNTYIDVDSQFGALIRVLNVANKLVFFQPDGLGVLSVDDRALIQDNNAGRLVLGSSGILPRFDYLSYTTGITTHDAVVRADSTFFYIDSQRKRIYTFGGGDVPVSVVKGVNSTLKALNYDYVNAGFDPDSNRIYFTIDDTTLVYNEFQQAFTHTLEIIPAHYITLDNQFYTIENRGEENPLLANDFTNTDYDDLGNPILISDGTIGTTIYKMGTGPTGVFNEDGGITADCYVDLIIHPEGVTKCSFDNMELTMEILNNSDEEVYTDALDTYQPVFSTIKQMIFSNSYISKTVDIVYGVNIKRIGRSWKLQVPLVTDSKVSTRSTRFVDTHLRVKIVFDNTTANRLRLHDVITYYRPISV